MNIAITGFYGTGSSAVVDYLRGFEGVSVALGDHYEHNIFFTPGGLFDLEDKILKNNDPFRSDEAVKTFQKAMQNLYKNNYGWFGSYEKRLGKQFLDSVEEFLDEIITFSGNEEWYGKYGGTRFSLPVWTAQTMLQLRGKKWIRKGIRDIIDKDSPTYHCLEDSEHFYAAASKFVQRYCTMCNRENTPYLLFDHLLWFQNAARIPHYFDDNFRLIAVKRDPRDIYFSEKYLWKSYYKTGVLPEKIEDFIAYYKWLYQDLKKDYRNVLVVDFEDLVYDFKNTGNRIQKFLKLENPREIPRNRLFFPEKSVENTQIFEAPFVRQEERSMIERELKEWLYDFPYQKEWNPERSFV